MSKIEIRAIGDKLEYNKETRTISGYAIVYNSRSQDLGGFTEVIKPGAITRCLSNNPDIRALMEHDKRQLLGRTGSGTLVLTDDSRGLHFDITPPDTTAGRDAITLLERRDIVGASFAFSVNSGGEKWLRSKGSKQRELSDIGITEISLTSDPAYLDTSVALRSMQSFDAEIQGLLDNKKRMIRLWNL